MFTTCSQLVHDFFMTWLWLLHDFLMPCSWISSIDLCITCPWLDNNLLIISGPEKRMKFMKKFWTNNAQVKNLEFSGLMKEIPMLNHKKEVAIKLWLAAIAKASYMLASWGLHELSTAQPQLVVQYCRIFVRFKLILYIIPIDSCNPKLFT